ncbi:MAG: phosphatase PAP2 family protein [Chitinophagaceae bacterium]
MKKIVFLLVSTFFFSGLALGQNVDINILRSINLGRPKSLDQAFIGITNTTIPITLAVPVGMYVEAWIQKDSSLKYHALGAVAGLAAASALTIGLKYLINRPRPYVTYPYLENVTRENDPSFPSGHATLAFSTATTLSLNFPKWYVIAPSFLWAGLVAYSRLDLGVHYPSDVLAGMIIGAGSSYLSFKITNWLDQRKSHHK